MVSVIAVSFLAGVAARRKSPTAPFFQSRAPGCNAGDLEADRVPYPQGWDPGILAVSQCWSWLAASANPVTGPSALVGVLLQVHQMVDGIQLNSIPGIVHPLRYQLAQDDGGINGRNKQL